MSDQRLRGTEAGKGEWLVLAVAMLYPSLMTWAYFVALSGQPSAIQQATYVVGKLLQFALPVAWIFLVVGHQPTLQVGTGRGIATGVGFGILAVIAMWLLYLGGLEGSPSMAKAGRAAAEKLASFQIRHWTSFAALGLFYSLFHSLLEEYYWRWFVFRRLTRYVPVTAAVAASSLAFTAHHVILLGVYFGYGSFWTYFFSLSVGLGGAVWAWIYHRSGSLLGPWLSHLLVDAGIFAVGYQLLEATAA